MFSWMGKARSALNCHRPVIPGTHLEPLPLPGVIAAHDEGHLRTRPNQRHTPQENVDQLGQFVQTGPPEEPSDRGDSGIGRLGRGQTISRRSRIHGTELVHVEELSIPAYPLLNEKYGPGRVQPYQHRNQKKHGSQQQKKKRRDNYVCGSLSDCIVQGCDRVNRRSVD